MYNKIISKYHTLNKSKSESVRVIADSLFRELPSDDKDFIDLCDDLIKKRENLILGVITTWIKKRNTTYQLDYVNTYEKWLYEEIYNWGGCDVLCYRVLNPMIEKFPCLYDLNISWANSEQTYVKRAAAVSLLHSSQSFKVNVPFDLVNQVCDLLIADPDLYVQKGVGWMLKYSYLSYPVETTAYLKLKCLKMDNIAFNYALKKMSPEIRSELIKFRNKQKEEAVKKNE